MKKRIYSFLVFFILLWAPVYSDEKLVITGGTYGNDYPPYYIVDQDGETKGLCPEIVSIIAEKLGISVKYIGNSWSGSLEAVKKGKADALIPVARSEEREKFLLFHDNILVYEKIVFFTLKENNIILSENPDSTKNYRAGVVRNYHYGKKFDSYNFAAKDVSYNEEELIKRLAAGRTDLIAGDELVIFYNLRRLGLEEKIKPLKPYIDKIPSYIAFSAASGKPEVAEKFSKELSLFRETKKYRDLLSKYGLKK